MCVHMQIWTWLQQFLRRTEQSTAAHPALHEPLQRSEEERADFERWTRTLVCRRLLDWLIGQYATFLTCPDELDEAIDFLDLPAARGFVIHLHQTGYSARDARHLMDYLCDRVRRLGYRLQLADRRAFQREGAWEEVERYYLKPRPNRGAQGRQNQRFGNVLIQLSWRDGLLYHLTFQANVYRDRLFEAPQAFGDLMRALAEAD